MNWLDIVGGLVTQQDNMTAFPSAWRVVSYCASPTVTLENLETKERLHFGIGGATAQGWKQLVTK